MNEKQFSDRIGNVNDKLIRQADRYQIIDGDTGEEVSGSLQRLLPLSP